MTNEATATDQTVTRIIHHFEQRRRISCECAAFYVLSASPIG